MFKMYLNPVTNAMLSLFIWLKAGGKLNCGYLIHAAGPKYHEDDINFVTD